jgi:type IX secretion system PorP/SprF family membrane protein
MHAGVGLLVSADNQGNGIISEFGLSAIYAYHLYATRELTINGGLQVSYVQRKLDTENFIYGDMLRPDGTILPSGSENYGTYRSGFPDFSVGFTGFYRGFYSGVALYHLLRPVHTMSYDPETRLSRKFTFFAGSIIPIYERRLGREFLQLSPNIIYIKQNKFNQLNYGLETHFRNVYVAGLWLRQNVGIRYGSIIFSGGYLAEKFRLRYSYDHQLTSPSVNISSLGAHELSLILILDLRKKITHRAIKCPKI